MLRCSSLHLGYETRYGGLKPAVYTMPGDPGGLARVDDILGIKMYKTTFTASPLVFGAFPSLHSGDAVLTALFLVFVFGPRAIPFAMGYAFWIWWATMYLGHHYVVDLVGGGAYAVIAFWVASFFLPSVLPPQEDLESLVYGKAKKGLHHDQGEGMYRQEKQTLFHALESDDEDEDETDNGSSSSSSSSSGSRGQDRNDEEIDFAMDCGSDTIEMNSVMVVSIPNRDELEVIREESLDGLEPLSPTGSHCSSSSSGSLSNSVTSTQRAKKQSRRTAGSTYRQSWNGWQGYESWIEVLATVNSPRTSPKTSPGTSPSHSPRSSTANLQGSSF
ncbi:Aureobasidin resistance protein Aur1 [Mortierella sp. NVP85]|nr:Aureobasidin resistance protein Aur1 [Mortierella sp. NVP85]